MTAVPTSAEVRLQREITAAIAASTALEDVLARIVRGAARLCRAPLALLTLLTDDREELVVVGAFGGRVPILGTRLPVAASLNGLVITLARSIRSTDVSHDPRPVVRQIPQMSGARGVLLLPLRNRHGPFGTLGVAKRAPWRFSDHDEGLLSQLADSASIAIQNAQLREQLQPIALRSAGSDAVERRAATSPDHPETSVGFPLRTSGHRPHHLSPRERDIMNLLITGKTCKEVASTLNMSGRTVQHYVERLKLRFHQPRLHALVGYVIKHDV